jgi:ketosteroid isomerase-like protein
MAEPIQEAIDGGRASEADEPIAALHRFYRALNTRDLSAMEAVWEAGDDPSMDNPLGGIRRGWPDIRNGYEALFAAKGSFHFEFHDYTLHVIGEVFLAVGRERGHIEASEERLPLAIRTTRLFRRRRYAWRQFHHHGSIERPEMLKAYLEAVAGQLGR